MLTSSSSNHKQQQHLSNNNNGSATAARGRHPTNKALADALAGVAASLISLWVFYPVELWKIHAQAAVAGDEGDPTNNNNNELAEDHKAGRRRLVVRIRDLASLLFAGIGTKTLQATTSSFCYFYLYSWILSLWHRQRHGLRYIHSKAGGAQQVATTTTITAPTRLLLTALAAVLNTLVTLPLDNVSTRQQVSGRRKDTTSPRNAEVPYDIATSTTTEEEDASNSTDDEACNSSAEEDPSSSDDDNHPTRKKIVSSSTATTVKSPVALLLSFLCNNRKQSSSSPSSSSILGDLLTQFGNCCHLWQGLTPALLLCCNPAITYTIFDVVKGRLLQRKKQGGDVVGSTQRQQRLNMTQAFLLGLVAKFVSTVATYPLILAKVKLMTTTMTASKDDPSNNAPLSSSSLLGWLRDEYRRHGVVRGLYRGCGWQLLHTVLKSALLLMLRERIEGTTRRWLLQPAAADGVVGASKS